MNIVAVTACPAGLAHTYMAAAALEKAGKKLGHNIKVETQGSMGMRNELTPAEIAAADVVVFAIDMAVAKIDRFKGRFIHTVGVAQAVRDSIGVINGAISATAAANAAAGK